MPPKKAKKTGDKAPPKRTTRAAAKKTATGDKRKRDDEDEEDSTPAETKKPKLSPKSARETKLEEYLKIRIKDLGFNVEPIKGHEPDDEDEDEPDEDWASRSRLRQRCDDRLDDIEEAIRTIGREKFPAYDIPEHKSDETRQEKRKKNEGIQDDEEIEPIAETKRVKPSKNFPEGRKYIPAKKLGQLVKQLEQQFGDELAKRRVQHPHDVSLAKYPSKSAKEAKEAAEARGKSPKLTRSLDKQWNKHGLSLRELLDLYNRHGSQTPAPVHDDLVKKCKQYGLSTVGNLWDLEKAILMYELASKQRMHGLSQEAINKIISALGDIEAPDGTEVDKGGDDGDGGADGAGPKGKSKGTSGSPKGDKTGDTGKEGSKDGKDDGKKGGKKNDKDAGAAKKPVGKSTRSSKKTDPALEDSKLINQKEITITDGGQNQRFTQTNVSGASNRCMWHAIQLLWLGRQKASGRKFVDQYPVNNRVNDLWDAVMHPAEGTTNPARQARRTLYTAMQQNSTSAEGGSLERRIRNRQLGDLDMLQLVADALDIEIFAYSPTHSDDGTTWHRYVRGEPQTDPARQIHLVSYLSVVHWTALRPIGDGSINLPALTQANRDPLSGMGPGITVSPLTRLQPGDEDNADLRPEDQHDAVEDGHVADMTEEEEEEDDNPEDEEAGEEDEDEGKDEDGADGGAGDGGPPPPPAAGATVAATSTAAKTKSSRRKSSPSSRSVIIISSDPSAQSPPGSQRRARRRARSRSKSQSRSTSRPQGVRKHAHTSQPLSVKAQKKNTKALRKIFEKYLVAMPSPYSMGGAIASPYPSSAVFCA